MHACIHLIGAVVVNAQMLWSTIQSHTDTKNQCEIFRISNKEQVTGENHTGLYVNSRSTCSTCNDVNDIGFI